MCSPNVLAYLADVYGSHRPNPVGLRHDTIFVHSDLGTLHNVSRTAPFHHNLGLSPIDRSGWLLRDRCLAVEATTMRHNRAFVEVLRIGTADYVRGRGVAVHEGGAYGCWFLHQPGSGAFLDVRGLLGAAREDLPTNVSTRAARRDQLDWCDVAARMRVRGFRFGREMVVCGGGCPAHRFNGSCVRGLRAGWHAERECDCSKSSVVLRCQNARAQPGVVFKKKNAHSPTADDAQARTLASVARPRARRALSLSLSLSPPPPLHRPSTAPPPLPKPSPTASVFPPLLTAAALGRGGVFFFAASRGQSPPPPPPPRRGRSKVRGPAGARLVSLPLACELGDPGRALVPAAPRVRA